MPSAKSIISIVYDYHKEAFPGNLIGKIGRLYQARCYLSPEHRINGARRNLMKQFLEKYGCELITAPQIQIPERLAAARAGIITRGRNTFAFANGMGPL